MKVFTPVNGLLFFVLFTFAFGQFGEAAYGQTIDHVNGDVSISGSGEVKLSPGPGFGDLNITTLTDSATIPDVNSLFVLLGSGNDLVTICGHVYVGGSVVFSLGNGENEVNVSQTEASSLNVNGSFFIQTGNGYDLVNFHDSIIAAAEEVNVNLGSGGSWFDLSNAFVGGNLKISGGTGEDNIYLGLEYISSTTGVLSVRRDIIITTHSRNDDIGIYGSVNCDSLIVNTGTHHNSVTVKGLNSRKDTLVESRSGRDRINFLQSSLGNLEISTGFGHDVVGITSTVVREDTEIKLSRGNDKLLLHDSSFLGQSSFKGGWHYDIAEQTQCDFGWAQEFGFELENFDF